MQQPSDVLKKPEQEKQEAPKPEPQIFTIQVSGEKADHAILDGGLWVLTIPINKYKRFEIVGLAWDACHRLMNLLDQMDEAKIRRRASLMVSGKEAISQGINKIGGLFKQ